jgi:hypothetical protein
MWSSRELAKKLANPIASLISEAMQYNHDDYGGVNDGASVDRLNIQPGAAAGHNPLLHRRARRVQRVLGVNPLEGTKMTLQERAYTSPIWFTPEM